MPAITLPDRSVRRFDGPVTGTTVAEAIGPGLARAALAMKLDGKLVDLATEIDHDATVVFITRRDPEALELIRHDAAHVLAEAVQELYPGTQVTIGPAIANGFYYDFARNQPFTPEDFPAIEAKMREIVARGEKFRRQVIDRDEAIQFFKDKGEKYKAEIIQDLPRDGDHHALPPGRLDRPLPRAAHALHRATSAGVQADEGRRRLLARRSPQRHAAAASTAPPGATRRNSTPTCTCWRRRNAATTAASARRWTCSTSRRRRPAACSGTPRAGGSTARAEAYMRRRLDAAGYQEVKTPQLLDRSLWEALRPLGEVPPAHVHRPGGGRGQSPRAEADELPVPHPDLPPGPALLPRAAAAAGGVRLLPSLRAIRRAARHHAGARRSPRTTRTSSAPRQQIAAETVRFVELLSSIYRDFGFPEFRVKFSDRPALSRRAPTRSGTTRRAR